MDALAVNTLLQSSHVHEMEGTAGSVAFDAAPQASLEEMLGGQGLLINSLFDFFFKMWESEVCLLFLSF